MLNLHAKFSSEDSLRYGAECGRLGRLTRNSKAVAKQRTTNKTRAPRSNWLSQMFSPPRRMPAKLAHR